MACDFTIPIGTELWLAPLAESDRSAIVPLINDRGIADRMLRVPHPYGDADFDAFLAITSVSEEGHPLHLTIHHSDFGPIGGFGFEGLCMGHRVELGYWLGQRFWGQGIIPRVIRGACEFAFREFRVARIIAHVFTSNPASARALEKSGFVCEGLLRNCFVKNDEPIDARLFSLLESDHAAAEVGPAETVLSESSLQIEQATLADVTEVTSLFDAYRQFYGQPSDLAAATAFIVERISRGESTILIARQEGVAVGFAQLFPSFSSVSMRRILILNDIFVRSESRRQGVGAALIEAATVLGRERNCRRLALCTAIVNTTAQSLYESRGWVRDEEFFYYSLEL
jgi:RimJ/RimL family protein N-acetyltransferase/GNAT superfamily N-acetyltransferase